MQKKKEGKKLKNIIFLVDTSGSLYSNKISSVNATLVECMGVIRHKVMNKTDLAVYYGEFNENMNPIVRHRNIVDENIPNFETKEENGFYKLTLFSKLYDGLADFFEAKKYEEGDFLIVLLTDGKAIDSMRYEAKLNRTKNIKQFRDAIKIVARVDGSITSSSQDLFEFVDNNANRIIEISSLANELDSLIFDGDEGNSSDSFYNSIFK